MDFDAEMYFAFSIIDFMKRMFILAALFSLSVLKIFAQEADTAQHIIPGKTNSAIQAAKPYVILISADGFRYDLAIKDTAKHLLQLSANGVRAGYMRPSFPSLTFPNHYTIVTGLYPAHHGIVDNSFYDERRNSGYSMSNKKQVADSSWYGGTPLWVLAGQQQMLTASFYWVASETAIQGLRPTYYYNYNERIGIDDRIQAVKQWLQLPPDKRPHFITFYFPEVDHEEHLHGVNSWQAKQAVAFVDESIGKMQAMVDSIHLPVNFIFVSDHGMADVDTVHTLSLPGILDTSKFIIPASDVLVHLYAKHKADIQPAYAALKKVAKEFDVYLADSVPARWHYSRQDDRFKRIGDILLVPHYPYVFSFSHRRVTTGKHGFNNYRKEMYASFYAWGPAFKTHMNIDGFANIHVYPLVAKILGLHYDAASIDGNIKVLQRVLR